MKVVKSEGQFVLTLSVKELGNVLSAVYTVRDLWDRLDHDATGLDKAILDSLFEGLTSARGKA